MSKRILAGIGAALIIFVFAVTAFHFFTKVRPTEAEVRAAVQSALPDGAVIDQMTFALFSDDRFRGRVSVKGTYSFTNDFFSLPTRPLLLMQSLASSQIFDSDIAEWWTENSSFYPDFNGQLGEFRKIFSSGQRIEFSGELPYLAVVDGTKIDSSGLDFNAPEGTVKPAFGYLDDALKVAELRKAILEWRDRRGSEAEVAAAAAAAEIEAEMEAAARAAAKRAEEEALASARAAAAAAEKAAAAAAAKAATEAAEEKGISP